MDILVFTMVAEWRCKEEEWKFEPEEDMFGRCVRVKENMMYTKFVRTLREAFSLFSTEINSIVSYWMPGEMSVLIDTKRPPVYIDSQWAWIRSFFIRGGVVGILLSTCLSLSLQQSRHSGIMYLRLMMTFLKVTVCVIVR